MHIVKVFTCHCLYMILFFSSAFQWILNVKAHAMLYFIFYFFVNSVWFEVWILSHLIVLLTSHVGPGPAGQCFICLCDISANLVKCQ